MANNRIFYACQNLAITPETKTTVDAGDMTHGVQSVGITTNFNLEQAFELGQIEIYENIEGTPDVELTMEKLLDGYPLLYHMASSGAVVGTSASGLAARGNAKCSVRLGIYEEVYNNISAGNTAAPIEVYMSGMYISNISYTIPAEGSMTESITLVGNNKQWLRIDNGTSVIDAIDVDAFDGFDEPAAIAGASGGIQRREDVLLSGCILPISIDGVVGSGYGNAITGLTGDGTATPLIHIQNISISTDFSREDVLELGRKSPYYRPAGFPIEVTCEIEAITISGDLIGAYEFGDPLFDGTSDSGNNLKNESIFVLTRAGYAWDLGTKNKISSVSYGGGDAGGGNVSVTYSYSNFNDLDVQHRKNGYVGFGWLKNIAGGDAGESDFGQGSLPDGLIGGGQSGPSY
jgi:hypothetical protein